MPGFMIDFLKANWKNLGGWRTERKIVVINVDDYGNVRLDSKRARENLIKAGLKLSSRMDFFDALETREDLEALFEVLDSVADQHGRPAKFTAYCLSSNPDFEKTLTNREYCRELLPRTFLRKSASEPLAYEGTWKLWLEGVAHGFLQPQFHGREHLSVILINAKLRDNSADLNINLNNASMAGLTSHLPGIIFTQAFALTPQLPLNDQLKMQGEIICRGMSDFAEIFGFTSLTFTPPSQVIHPLLYPIAVSQGIKAIDKPYRVIRQLGNEKSMLERNRTGVQAGQAHVTLVRNVVFEPSEDAAFDPVKKAMRQIEAAFRWGKPAIISSHRVNYSGHIDPQYRAKGLAHLRRLLDAMTRRWPDLEFLGADELAELFAPSKTETANRTG